MCSLRLNFLFCILLVILPHIMADYLDTNSERKLLKQVRYVEEELENLFKRGNHARKNKVSRQLPSSCTPKYEKLGHSTMCEYDDSSEAKNIGVSEDDKKIILREHNKYRANTSPPAKNMQKMYYDEEIAIIAQKWATHCPDLSHAHDTSDNRLVPGYGILIGQNYAYGYPTWEETIKVWHDEEQDYKYAEADQDFYYTVLITHYTQEVTAVSSRIGCGFAECPHGPTYVCNYSFGNEYDLGHPYLDGPKCGDCPSKCVDGLCDCKGKLCRNGGSLDVGTCSCKCESLWKGDTCEELDCPPRDEEYCGTPQPIGYTKENCDWSNVPKECPFMCGLCTGPQAERPAEDEWGGKDKCRDHSHCGDEKHQYTEENCEVYDEVKEYCPKMCGTC